MLHIGLVVVATWMIVVFGSGVLVDVAREYHRDLPLDPYLHLADAARLYLAIPALVVAAIALLLWPGLLVALFLGRGSRWTRLLPAGFTLSFLLLVAATSLFKAFSGQPLDRGAFLWIVGLLTVLAGAALGYRVVGGQRPPIPRSAADRRRLVLCLLITVVLLIATIPMVIWQDTNPDGVELFDLSRSLSTNVMPRFPTPEGVRPAESSFFPMAYPVHWFMVLFGPLEAAARLPLFLYLPVLFCLLIELVEFGSPRSLGGGEEAALSLALCSYAVAMGFNASYNPYLADFSLAAGETLTIVWALAGINSLWRGDGRGVVLFGILAFLCRPTGILLLGFAGLATLLTIKDQRSLRLRHIGIAIVACIVVASVHNRFLLAPASPAGGGSFPGAGLLERYRYLRFADFHRFVWAAFPAGVLPFASLAAFKWQDTYARFLTVVSLAYFAFFYFPAFTALHHFLPVMLLPLAVFWRLWLQDGFRQEVLRRVPRPLAVVLLTCSLALWMSLPRRAQINRTIRRIAETIELRVADIDAAGNWLAHSPALLELFPTFRRVDDPARELVAPPTLLIFYARHVNRVDRPVNYIVQPADGAAVAGFTRVADDGVISIYVRDVEQWRRDREAAPPTDYRSRLYDVPDSTLFAFVGIREGSYDVDLRALARRLISGARAGPRGDGSASRASSRVSSIGQQHNAIALSRRRPVVFHE